MKDPNNRQIELNESVDILRLEYIINNIEKYCKCKGMKKSLKIYYNKLKLNPNGIKISYRQKMNRGRYFTNTISLQSSFSNSIRNTILNEAYYDIDIKNSAATLLLQYCKINNINCVELEFYINNREACINSLSEFFNISFEGGKKLIIDIIYCIPFKNFQQIYYNKIDWFDKFIDCIQFIKYIVNTQYGTSIPLIIENLENTVLMCMVDYLEAHNIEINVLIHDGCIISKKYKDNSIYNINDLLIELSKHIKSELNFDIEILNKSMVY